MMYIFVLMLFIKFFSKIGKNRVIAFVAKSSLWIYLWHVLALLVVNAFLYFVFGLLNIL